jgi:hypothetical protein
MRLNIRTGTRGREFAVHVGCRYTHGVVSTNPFRAQALDPPRTTESSECGAKAANHIVARTLLHPYISSGWLS